MEDGDEDLFDRFGHPAERKDRGAGAESERRLLEELVGTGRWVEDGDHGEGRMTGGTG